MPTPEYALPFALGIFEESPYEQEIMERRLFEGEQKIKERWTDQIQKILAQTSIQVPDLKLIHPVYGGRKGKHSEHLQPLLDEMSEVFKIDPTAEW